MPTYNSIRFSINLLILFGALLLRPIPAAQAQNPYVIPNRVGNSTERSGSITAGGAWQQLAPQNMSRMRLFVENYCSATTQGISTAESIFIAASVTTPTSLVGSIEVSPCGTYSSDTVVVSTNPIWVYANTTGHLFAAKEW